jgi:hypothetical protein
MAIREKIEKALTENKRITAEDPQKLSEFIEDLRKEGLLIKKEYDLPPLDTVGRQLYQEMASNSPKKF